MPTVSAIITTFNRKQYLGPAMESVLAQTHRDLELLVLDNSSSDGTEELIQGFSDPRIRYIRHPPMVLGAARNLGLKKSKGEFIAFLDDDDEWLPDKLKLQLEVFGAGGADLALVYGGFVYFDQVGKDLAVFPPLLRGKVLADLLKHEDRFTGSASNPMIWRDSLEAIGGYDTRLVASEDWEAYVRLAERYQVDFTPQPVVKIRRHAGQISGHSARDITGRFEAEKAVFDRYHEVMNRQLTSLYLQSMGGKLCRLGHLAPGRKMILRALTAYPFNPRAYAQLLFSFGGQPFYFKMHRLYLRWYCMRHGVPRET